MTMVSTWHLLSHSHRRIRSRVNTPKLRTGLASRSSGTATQWASAPMSIPAALRCTFCSKARSRLRWLLALFGDFFGISCSSFKFSDSRSAESVRSGKSPKQDHWVGLSKSPAQCHITNAVTEKLRTRLTIGHLLQWALGHSFRSQIGSDNLSAVTQKPQFLTRSKTVHSLGG